jgi:uncharacterized repeat protein (TIGR02543 family)
MRQKEFFRKAAMLWLLLVSAIAPLHADGDFTPTNPPDPNANFKVAVQSERGYTSGAGFYTKGTTVWVSTSAYSDNFTFAYWMLNGERYTGEQAFYYTVGDRNVTLEAVYDFKPVSPNDPVPTNAYRLYLQTDTEGSCSFNRASGAKEEAGSSVYVSAYPSQGYVFNGWYDGDTKVSDDMSFSYTMPEATTTLTARFVYKPENPGDPTRVESSVAAEAPTGWYTVGGLRLQERPQQKGLYVHDGRKVVIR